MSMLGSSVRAARKLCSSLITARYRNSSLLLGEGDSCPFVLNNVLSSPRGAAAKVATPYSFTSIASGDNRLTDAYSAIELALDSVVKIFTVSSSPNYFLPWQNKPQRETTGSGTYASLLYSIKLLFSSTFPS